MIRTVEANGFGGETASKTVFEAISRESKNSTRTGSTGARVVKELKSTPRPSNPLEVAS